MRRNYNINDQNLKRIDLDGAELHYIEHGENNKQAVVFVHASLTDYRAWEFQSKPFSQKFRVISYSDRLPYPNKWHPYNYHFANRASFIQ